PPTLLPVSSLVVAVPPALVLVVAAPLVALPVVAALVVVPLVVVPEEVLAPARLPPLPPVDSSASPQCALARATAPTAPNPTQNATDRPAPRGARRRLMHSSCELLSHRAFAAAGASLTKKELGATDGSPTSNRIANYIVLEDIQRNELPVKPASVKIGRAHV